MRIEITSYEKEPESVNIDFEDGRTLVNLNFTKEEMEELHGVVVEILEGWYK